MLFKISIASVLCVHSCDELFETLDTHPTNKREVRQVSRARIERDNQRNRQETKKQRTQQRTRRRRRNKERRTFVMDRDIVDTQAQT